MRSGDNSKPISGPPESGVRDDGNAPAAPQGTEQPTKPHFLTVIRTHRPNGCVPHICMSGRWLERAGFASGSRIAVTATDGQLVITVAAPPGPMQVREPLPPPGWWSPPRRRRPKQRPGGDPMK